MTLNELVNIPDEKRDHQWEVDFFMAITSGNLKLMVDAPQQGPDGWPYLLTQTSADATEPAQKIMSWLATKGVGLVVNPQKEYPDYEIYMKKKEKYCAEKIKVLLFDKVLNKIKNEKNKLSMITDFFS